jgi:hypothetical protein
MSFLGTRKRRFTALVAAVALIGIGGGAAYAFWTGGGSGAGGATTGASGGFTVAGQPLAEGAPLLTPGGPAQTVTFTVTNDGTGGQYLNGVTAIIGLDAEGTWDAAGCSAADFTVATPVIVAGDLAGGAVRTGTVDVSMVDSDVDQVGCQNVVAPLYFTAN